MEALRFEHITKSFGSVKANDDVSFSIEKGLIYSILGENGSGKTSLMNVVAGIYHQDAGEVYINNELAVINSPRDAFSYRVGMIHQHFKLIDKFTAVENVLLGLTKADYKAFHEEQREKLEQRKAELEVIKAKVIQQNKADLKDGKITVAKLLTNLKRRNELYKKVSDYRRYYRRSRGYSIPAGKERIENMCIKYGFEVNPSKHVFEMSVSEKQELEILKVLYRGVDVLILDEPTAVLTPQETDKLFDVLKNMKKLGKTIIIITHKLNEVLEISDKVVVLRKGQYIGEVNTKDTNEQKLTEMMVGKKVKLDIKRNPVKNPADRLFVNNLTVKDETGRTVLDNISFTARGGEILGVAGIAGNGQKQLLESISGLLPLESGSIVFKNPKKNVPVTLFHKKLKQVKQLSSDGLLHNVDGTPTDLSKLKNKEIVKLINEGKLIFNDDEIIDLKNKNPLEIRELGIRLSFVPEDRLGMGLVGSMDLTDNMMLRSYKKGKAVFVDRNNPSALANEIVEELEVSTPSIKTQVKQLSGGNIQKVLVGREIAFAPKVLMTAYPVRGLDINSSYMIYNLLDEQKSSGVAVIYVGEDLDVLMALCDRLLILSKGKVVDIVDPRKVDKKTIGLMMTKGER